MSLLKKACSIVLVAAVVLALFACVATGSAFAEGGPTLTVKDTKVSVADGTASVDVDLATNGNEVDGVQFEIGFDETKLTPAAPAYDLGDGQYSIHNLDYDTGKIFVMLYSASTFEDGTIVTLNFELPDAVLGAEEFALTVSNCIFTGDTEVDGNVEDGTLTVILYGDVNKDGLVNSDDVLDFTHYSAGWDGYDETTICMAAADVNDDGSVNSNDVLDFIHYIAGWDGFETLPIKSAE